MSSRIHHFYSFFFICRQTRRSDIDAILQALSVGVFFHCPNQCGHIACGRLFEISGNHWRYSRHKDTGGSEREMEIIKLDNAARRNLIKRLTEYAKADLF